MLIAPNAATYATRVPYITPAEFKAHPTGVETSKLVSGATATTAAQDQALLQIIRRASSMADGICGKILSATVDTQSGAYRIQRDGRLRIALDYSPVIAVDSVTAGLQPGTQIPLVQDADWWLDGRILHVPTNFTWAGGPVPFGGKVYATTRYLNGWANSVLSVAAPAGSSSISVNNALGIMPGMTLSLLGAEVSEYVVVSPSFVPTTSLTPTTIPLVSPTSFSYALSDICTAFPSDVKLAVIFLASGIIKARGTKALTMASTRSAPETETSPREVAEQEMALAEEILSVHRRVL